jgi:hypothetical protein
VVLAYDSLIQEPFDTLRCDIALRYWFGVLFFYQYTVTQFHAFVADVDIVSVYQLADFQIGLAAETAGEDRS